jgi:hypothetical protein
MSVCGPRSGRRVKSSNLFGRAIDRRASTASGRRQPHVEPCCRRLDITRERLRARSRLAVAHAYQPYRKSGYSSEKKGPLPEAGQARRNDDELQKKAGRSISNACCSIFNVHSVDILRVCAVLGMRNISRSGSIHPGLGDTRQQAEWCTSPSCYEQCTCRNARSSRSSRRELGRSASVTGLDRAGIAFCLDNG